jgi:hypothetical protein
LSVDAPQERVTLDTVLAVLWKLDGADGGCVSPGGGQAVVEALTVAFTERLPAACEASTENEYEVHGGPPNVWT